MAGFAGLWADYNPLSRAQGEERLSEGRKESVGSEAEEAAGR